MGHWSARLHSTPGQPSTVRSRAVDRSGCATGPGHRPLLPRLGVCLRGSSRLSGIFAVFTRPPRWGSSPQPLSRAVGHDSTGEPVGPLEQPESNPSAQNAAGEPHQASQQASAERDQQDASAGTSGRCELSESSLGSVRDLLHEHAHDDKPYGSSSWVNLMLTLPLELAATAARTDQHWLQKRNRKRWWSKEHFPKVPGDSLADVHLTQPAIALWQKLIPLGVIFFCASFNLTILQNLKDAIMVTSAGAETLPFLASFCVLPASLVFFMAYGRLVEAVQPSTVFYACVTPLVAFYVFFVAVMYPASAWLHPHGMYEALASAVPVGLHGLLKMVENWTFSLFFCIAELWGPVVISLLFWTLANEVCTVADAKIIYPLMGISANVALVVAGNYMKYVNRVLTQGSLLLSLRWLVGTVVVLTGVMMAAKAFTDRYIVIQVKPGQNLKPAKKKKRKGSFGESFAVLKGSPKIRNLALLVMSYGVSHRLFEFAWKGQLRVLYPSAQAYQGVLADVSIATGYMTIALMLSGRFVFQYLGWGAAAAATPAVMLLTGTAFFGLSLASIWGGVGLTWGSFSVAWLGVMAGAVTQVFARSAKFSLFDPAKEMVYIEMDKDEKSKGKAAVDLVGSQVGKSGASWLTGLLLLGLGSISAAMPVITGTFLVVIASWLGAVRHLGQQIEEHEKRKEAAAAAEEERRAQEAAALLASADDDAGGPRSSGSNGASTEPHFARWPGDVTDALDDAGGNGGAPLPNLAADEGHPGDGSVYHTRRREGGDSDGGLHRRLGYPQPT
ncbi:hypothetical protein WJX72_008977 [[Myrmecia] bisecta]|uniref:ADP,ATP carrier protein n=1 Tax=[Myrmecia] bisecta TaxID=41462 RepID=A0AAW1QGD3_9CHLO